MQKKIKEFEDILNGSIDTTTKGEIEVQIDKLCQCMHTIGKNLVSTKKPSYAKPYWNKQLTYLTKVKKKVWYTWKQMGCPRGDHPCYLEYKNAKRLFRQSQRQSEIEYEQQKIKDITKYHEIDQTFFWYLVNKRKECDKSAHPLKLANGKTVCNPSDICDEWSKYFESLYQPVDKPEYDEVFKHNVLSILIIQLIQL